MAGGHRRRTLLGSAPPRAPLGARKGNEEAKMDLAFDSAAGRLSSDGLAGVTRGGSDVEIGGG